MDEKAKVGVGVRIIAALIDGLVGYVIGLILSFIPFIGAVVGAAYMLGKDGLFEGQSIGKKVMKLQVVTEQGTKADYAVSVKRNLILAIPNILMIIPILGLLLAPFVALAVVAIEFILVMTDQAGRRLGDKWAGTQVIAYQAGQANQPV